MSYRSLAHLVREHALSKPDFDVLTFENDGAFETRTYQQLWNNGQRLAQGLDNAGLRRGDRVGLLLQNHPEFVELMVAAAILGLVLVPLDPRTKGEKLSFMLSDAECVAVVCGDYALNALNAVIGELQQLRLGVVLGSGSQADGSGRMVGWNDLLPTIDGPDREIAVRDPAEAMQIMYTSGTTGDPKGIVVAHARFVAAGDYGRTMFGYRADERPYTGLSLTHGNAQFVTLVPALAMSLRAVFSRKFTKSRMWDVIRSQRCTTFTLLGGMATAVYSEKPRPDDRDNPVRLVVSAGMPEVIWKAFSERYGVEILEFYGAMEGGLLLNPPRVGPVGSCGRPPASLLLRIVNDEGQDVADGEPGEMLFAMSDGAPMRVEYLGKPEESAKKTLGGWLHSGDVVRKDAEGWVYYLHRVGGGIRHNGEFINPAAVEKVLAECPEVEDVFVWGIPSASGAPGEKDVVAAVVPASNRVGPQDIFSWCRERLEPNMVPTFVQLVSEIPKTASEKPQQRFLKQAFDGSPNNVFTEIRAKSKN